MSFYSVTRALLWRQALGIQGVPRTNDAWRLLEALGPAIRVRRVDGAAAAWLSSRPNGNAEIYLPRISDEREDALSLIEEVAHWFCRSGGPPPPLGMPLDRHRETSEEAEAAAFSAAWFLSDEAISACRDEGEFWALVEETGVPESVVARAMDRWRSGGSTNDLGGLPGWSALHTHSVVVRRGVATTLLVRGPRIEAEVPAGRDLDQSVCWETARLAALREDEAPLVYAGQEVTIQSTYPGFFHPYGARLRAGRRRKTVL